MINLIFNRIYYLLIISALINTNLFSMECHSYAESQCNNNCHCIDLHDCKGSTDQCYGGWIVLGGEPKDIDSGFAYCWSVDSNQGSHGNGESRGEGSGLSLRIGYLGKKNGDDIFVTSGGLEFTKSQLLQTTEIFGQWAADKILDKEFAQATFLLIITILKYFDNDHPYHQDIKRYSHFKIKCILEFLEKRCLLEKENHYCFKDYNDHNGPVLQLDTETIRKREKWIEILNKAKV